MDVIWSEEAADDLKDIHASISVENVEAAERVRAKILKRVRMLATTPHIGRPGRVDDTRELVVGSYVVAYTVQNHRAEILAVLHGAQQWPEAF